MSRIRGKNRVGFTELGSLRPGAGRGELQFVSFCRTIGRWHAREAKNSTGIRYNGLHQHPITIESNSPALEPQFVEVEYLVEVRFEPRSTVQTTCAGNSSNIN